MKPTILAVAAAALLTAACGTNSGNEQAPAASQQITGAGSTFVYPVLSAWAADYQKQSGARINYQSIGSGGGIAQIKAGTVDFGATDQPLDRESSPKPNLAQFPIVIGGVVAGREHRRHRAGKAQAHRPIARRHLRGQDHELERPGDRGAQPGREAAEREHHRRAPFRRFGHDVQLHPLPRQVSPEWKTGPGEGTTVSWPIGVGGKGNEGVAVTSSRSRTRSAMSNMPTRAKRHGLRAAAECGGHVRQPSAETFQAAAQSADWKNASDFFLVMTNAPGANA